MVCLGDQCKNSLQPAGIRACHKGLAAAQDDLRMISARLPCYVSVSVSVQFQFSISSVSVSVRFQFQFSFSSVSVQFQFQLQFSFSSVSVQFGFSSVSVLVASISSGGSRASCAPPPCLSCLGDAPLSGPQKRPAHQPHSNDAGFSGLGLWRIAIQ